MQRHLRIIRNSLKNSLILEKESTLLFEQLPGLEEILLFRVPSSLKAISM